MAYKSDAILPASPYFRLLINQQRTTRLHLFNSSPSSIRFCCCPCSSSSSINDDRRMDGSLGAFVDLGMQYEQEFTDSYMELRRWLQQLGCLQSVGDSVLSVTAGSSSSKKLTIGSNEKPPPRGLVRTLLNTSRVGSVDMALLLNTFSWIVLLQLAHKLAFDLLSALLRPALWLLCDQWRSPVLALCVLPALAYTRLDPNSDRRSRFALLPFAALEGLLLGHLFYSTHLDMPSSSVFPLAILLCSPLLSGWPFDSRLPFLGSFLALGFILNCVLTLLFSGSLTVNAILMILAYGCLAVVIVQLYLDHCETEPLRFPHKYMLGYELGAVLIQVVFLCLFGVSNA